MVTFEISVNGVPLYRTGVGDFGILTAEVMWARIQQQAGTVHAELSIHATSVADGGTDRHAKWPRTGLKVGDEIRIRVVDAGKFDEPSWSGTLDSYPIDDEC